MQVTSRCPDELILAALADGTLPELERRDVILHVADCARCLSLVGTLARLSRDPATATVPSALTAKARALTPRATAWYVPAVAAAALVLASTALLYRTTERTSPRSTIESTSASTERGPRAADQLAIISPRANEPLPATVTWRAVPDATGYVLTITREDGSLAWQTRSETTAAVVPQSFASAQSYFLIVKAVLPGGRTLTSRAVRVSGPSQ